VLNWIRVLVSSRVYPQFHVGTDCTDLQTGDSGSWVIDATANNVLGYVVAISTRTAYLIPLMELFEQINDVLKPKTQICIPSPFKMLLSLARRHYAMEPELANRYASEALSPEVLDMRTSDQSILLVRSAIQNDEDKGLLTRLLCHIGADLRPILRSLMRGSVDSIAKRYHLDPDLQPVLLRLCTQFVTESEFSIATNPAKTHDIEKGKTHTGKVHFH
jgi:hypothetical protein